MAQKKENKPSFNKVWQNHFDITGLELSNALQRSIAQIRPFRLDTLIDATNRVQELLPPIGLKGLDFSAFKVTPINVFKEFFDVHGNVTGVIEKVYKIQLQTEDFTYNDVNDLEATSFELFPGPELIVPEQEIILKKHVSNVEKVIANIYQNHAELHYIHHREFEELIAELLKSRGFNVHLTKQTRDGGTDIIAIQHIDGSPMKFLVECKKYSPGRKIGVDIIRSFSHVINTQQANKGIIFTTSYFTRDAKREQQTFMPYLLDLRDQDDVLDWVKKYVE